tara:strand:+ start:4465 stop:5715 length:1251 start_codon:yes stop_codon:yes gene_type:complete
MAIDNRLSLAAQPTNLQAAITGGLSLGENLRNSGVRDAVLRQQEQVGAQTIQQNKVVQQQQKSAFMNKLATGLKTVPIANRAAIISQQMGMMETMGFDRADILSQGLSDKDLDQVIAGTQASVAAPQKPTSGMQDFSAMTEGLSPEDIERAKRINLGLDPRAAQNAPTLVDIGGSKYMQVGDKFYVPETAEQVVVDETTGEVLSGGATSQTPKAQVEAEASKGAAVATARAEAEAQVELDNIPLREAALLQAQIKELTATAEIQQDLDALDPIKAELKAKQIGMAESAINSVDQLLSGDLDRVTGWMGKTKTALPATQDILNVAQRLNSMLTAENLGIMSGVLSETDIKIIQDLASGMGFEPGKGFSGSKQGTMDRLVEIKASLEAALARKENGINQKPAQEYTSKSGITFTVRDQ